MPSTVRALIFHVLPPETCSLNISEKVPKIWKIVYFEITSSQNIVFVEKQLEKKNNKKNTLVVRQKQNKNVLLHMS